MSVPNSELTKKKINSSDDEESVVVVPKSPEPKLLDFKHNKPDVYLTKEGIQYRRAKPGVRDEEEGLYDPDEDLWVQFHTDGIDNPKKRRLFIRELPSDVFQWRREETHHKLRELEEDFLNGLENAIAGFSDPFQHLREEYQKTRWNRIKNISPDGDERIQRIEALCRNIAQVYEEQGHVVLRKPGAHTEPKKDTYPRAFSSKNPRKGI